MVEVRNAAPKGSLVVVTLLSFGFSVGGIDDCITGESSCISVDEEKKLVTAQNFC